MTDNNSTSASYEQFLNFVIPRTKKKITKQLVSKIRQIDQPIQESQSNKYDYDAVCAVAKLLECEISLLRKIQRQIQKFSSKIPASQAVDLQITQLYQALDIRGNGRLTRKQLKGILSTHQQTMISDSDIDAIMRRMDSDGDDEISFSDFFTNLLPYLIYGENRPVKSAYDLRKGRAASENKPPVLNIKVRSSSSGRTKPK